MEKIEIDSGALIYSLSIEDVQNVATEEYGYELSISEIKRVQEIVERDINWYDIINYAIQEIKNENKAS